MLGKPFSKVYKVDVAIRDGGTWVVQQNWVEAPSKQAAKRCAADAVRKAFPHNALKVLSAAESKDPQDVRK